MATVQQAIDELDDLHGVDLEPAEALSKLNEGHTELCVRAEWTRATVSVGPTVEDQAVYTLPSTVYRPLKLYVDSEPFHASDEDTARRITAGELTLRARGLWYITHNSSGTEQFGLYPAPGTAGLTIEAYSIVYPSALTADGNFAVPADFHRALIHYAKSVSLGSSEDDIEGENVSASIFDGYVARLRRHRLSRTGRGPVDMRIVGVNA